MIYPFPQIGFLSIPQAKNDTILSVPECIHLEYNNYSKIFQSLFFKLAGFQHQPGAYSLYKCNLPGNSMTRTERKSDQGIKAINLPGK